MASAKGSDGILTRLDLKLTAEGQSAEQLVEDARRAFVLMLAFVALIWFLQLVNVIDGYGLDRDLGIYPRDLERIEDIVTAPFLHLSWTHIESNSGPLFIFGFLAAFRGVRKFLGVTAVCVLTSGLGVWLFSGSHQITVGASGLIYGYFGYVVVKGIFDRHLADVLIGLVMALSFAYILVAVVPGTPGVSWTGHLGGLAGGIASGWIFRRRLPSANAAPAAFGSSPLLRP